MPQLVEDLAFIFQWVVATSQ